MNNELVLVQSYTDNECNEFEVMNNDELVAYVVEDKLDEVYTVYYDYNEEFEEYSSSYVFDTLEECLELVYCNL